jgi:3'-phosphoadenosine 5'-phosphosulfate (PAPS) 3'-phosphatase
MAPGLGTRALKLSVDGVDYSNAILSAKLVSSESDSDTLTFAEASAGGSRAYKLAMTLVQDVAAASLWRKIWDTAGSEVECIVRPAGGTTVSATQPEFTFTAIVAEPDGDFLGGDADTSTTARFTIDVEWEITSKPELVAA